MELIDHLPEKIPFKYPNQSEEKISKLNPEEQSLILANKAYIEKNLFKWKLDKQFKFNLPKSIFSSQGEKQKIDIPQNYQQKNNITKFGQK